MENTPSLGSRVSFNLTPNVSFYKRRRPHVEPEEAESVAETNYIMEPEPTEEFVLQPLNLSHLSLEQPPQSLPSPLPPQPPPPLTLLSLHQQQHQEPAPPPPLNLRTTLNQIIMNSDDECWPPSLSIRRPKRWLYEDDGSPIDYVEIQQCRQIERELIAEAHQRAYADFLLSITPPYHGTPHSQRTPASVAIHCSLPPSPLSLSPAATPRVA